MKEIIDNWLEFLYEHKDDINAGAGILLFSDDGKVLVSKRGESVNNPDTIGTIGGHLTRGEEPSIGAKREFEEEAGFSGPFDNFRFLHLQDKPDGFRYYTFIASTKNTAQNFDPAPEFAHEIQWNKWIDFDELVQRDDLHPGLVELFSIPHVVARIKKFIGDI